MSYCRQIDLGLRILLCFRNHSTRHVSQMSADFILQDNRSCYCDQVPDYFEATRQPDFEAHLIPPIGWRPRCITGVFDHTSYPIRFARKALIANNEQRPKKDVLEYRISSDFILDLSNLSGQSVPNVGNMSLIQVLLESQSPIPLFWLITLMFRRNCVFSCLEMFRQNISVRTGKHADA